MCAALTSTNLMTIHSASPRSLAESQRTSNVESKEVKLPTSILTVPSVQSLALHLRALTNGSSLRPHDLKHIFQVKMSGWQAIQIDNLWAQYPKRAARIMQGDASFLVDLETRTQITYDKFIANCATLRKQLDPSLHATHARVFNTIFNFLVRSENFLKLSSNEKNKPAVHDGLVELQLGIDESMVDDKLKKVVNQKNQWAKNILCSISNPCAIVVSSEIDSGAVKKRISSLNQIVENARNNQLTDHNRKEVLEDLLSFTNKIALKLLSDRIKPHYYDHKHASLEGLLRQIQDAVRQAQCLGLYSEICVAILNQIENTLPSLSNLLKKLPDDVQLEIGNFCPENPITYQTIRTLMYQNPIYNKSYLQWVELLNALPESLTEDLKGLYRVTEEEQEIILQDLKSESPMLRQLPFGTLGLMPRLRSVTMPIKDKNRVLFRLLCLAPSRFKISSHPYYISPNELAELGKDNELLDSETSSPVPFSSIAFSTNSMDTPIDYAIIQRLFSSIIHKPYAIKICQKTIDLLLEKVSELVLQRNLTKAKNENLKLLEFMRQVVEFGEVERPLVQNALIQMFHRGLFLNEIKPKEIELLAQAKDSLSSEFLLPNNKTGIVSVIALIKAIYKLRDATLANNMLLNLLDKFARANHCLPLEYAKKYGFNLHKTSGINIYQLLDRELEVGFVTTIVNAIQHSSKVIALPLQNAEEIKYQEDYILDGLSPLGLQPEYLIAQMNLGRPVTLKDIETLDDEIKKKVTYLNFSVDVNNNKSSEDLNRILASFPNINGACLCLPYENIKLEWEHCTYLDIHCRDLELPKNIERIELSAGRASNGLPIRRYLLKPIISK